MRKDILMIVVTFAVAIGASLSYANNKPYNHIHAKQMLIDKCNILETTIELSLKIMQKEEKRHKKEIALYKAKIDGMYNKLILGDLK